MISFNRVNIENEIITPNIALRSGSRNLNGIFETCKRLGTGAGGCCVESVVCCNSDEVDSFCAVLSDCSVEWDSLICTEDWWLWSVN